MITESKIILPKLDNDGFDLSQQIAHVEDAILQQYGGFNVAESKGAWRNDEGKVYRDECLTYVIAADWADANNAIALRQIARYAASLMQQECVYMCLDGQVEFVEPYVK